MNKVKIAILGFGKEGQSILRFLKKNPVFKNAEIWICDKDTKQKLPSTINKQLGKNYLKNLKRFDLVFRSPGIPYLHTELQRARHFGTAVSSATNLFFNAIIGEKPIIIGITGSKGKGTVSSLLAHILKTAKKRVVLAGNIGKPMLDTLASARHAEYIILELSSFQLQDMQFSPDIAVILDIFPEHLDHHKNFREYTHAKSTIGKLQTSDDAIFFFSNNRYSKQIAQKSPAKKYAIKPTSQGLQKNKDMASSIAKQLGISQRYIKNALETFHGLHHRLEKIKNLQHIQFYNDSAASNPQATKAAIESFNIPIILIAGGRDKKAPYTDLIDTIKKSRHVKGIILIGENKQKLAKLLQKHNPLLRTSLKAAIKTAYSLAQKYKEVVVLFSPGATSFDMFKNYEDRGNQFKTLVKKLE